MRRSTIEGTKHLARRTVETIRCLCEGEYGKDCGFLVLWIGNVDKISGTSRKQFRTNKMKLKSASKQQVESKRIFNLEWICE